MRTHVTSGSGGLLGRISVGVKIWLITGGFLAGLTFQVVDVSASIKAQRADGTDINIAGRQRMLTQKFTKEIFLQLNTGTASRDNLANNPSKRLFEESLSALRNGGQTYADLGMTKPLALKPASSPEVIAKLDEVKGLWRELIAAMETVVGTQNTDVAALESINERSVSVLKTMNQAVGMLAKASEQKTDALSRELIISALLIALIGSAVSVLVIRNIVRPLQNLLATSKRIAQGQLATSLDENILGARDELGSLARAVAEMQQALARVIESARDSGIQMGHSSHQVAAISHEISSVSEDEQRKSEGVLQATQVLEDFSATVNDHITAASQLSNNTREQADSGIAVVNENIAQLRRAVEAVGSTSVKMQNLSNASAQITEIVDSIQNIADQTNLLALNAAIEAARAGEQGRGFAVVADEVRNLASRTSSSTAEISELIQTLGECVTSSVEAMNEVADCVHVSQDKSQLTVDVFQQMVTGVEESAEANTVIQQFNEQQREQLASLREQLNGLFQVLKTSSAKATSTSVVADELSTEADKLQALLAHFDLGSDANNRVMQPAASEKRAAPRLECSVRVTVCQGDISCPEAVSKDISLTGLKIRLKETLDKTRPVLLSIMRPQNDIDAYQQQTPLDIRANIVRCSPDNDAYLYGLQFQSISAQERAELEAIFDYFNYVPSFEPVRAA